MRSWDLCTLVYLLPLAFADVEFVAPAAGADVAVGTILVQWKDSGKQPPISDLTQYTLSLMVGGDEEDNMVSAFIPVESELRDGTDTASREPRIRRGQDVQQSSDTDVYLVYSCN
jgi:hypothetical protein